ncbi:MAG: universal stress protein [Methyloligellaceae bacterium]
MQYELLLEEVKKQLKSERDAARRLFEREAAHYPEIQSDFMGCDGNVSGIVAHRGRLSDLTVLSAIDDDAPEQDFWSEVRDGAIFHSARPIVVTPREADVPDTLGETVVIAWKDSVESARAIGAARPFIVRAKMVHVVTAGTDGADEESIKDLEDYLSLYNSDIEVHVVGRNKRNVAELLATQAAQYPDALMVMGAYSQWRWKEWAFGGVTEYMLREAPVPVLMMH